MQKKYFLLLLFLLISFLNRLGAEVISPPEIRITAPGDGITLPYSVQVYIEAEAQDPDGIRQVDFFVDNVELKSSFRMPYKSYWKNVTPGAHEIKVKAIDTKGDSSEAVIHVTLSSVPLEIGYWAFDETYGETAEDTTGNGNDGRLHNITYEAGVENGCFRFNGSSSVTTGKCLMNNLASFTVAGFIKPAEFGTKKGFFGQNDLFEFGFNGGNAVLVWVKNGGTINAFYPFPPDEWHHVAVTGNGSSLSLYFDGNLSKTVEKQTDNYGNSTYPFNIGGDGIFEEGGDFFSGCIDEVRIYSTDLSQVDLKKLTAINGNIRPMVDFIQPIDGQQVYGPLDIPLEVNAYDDDGDIKLVEFYANDLLLGRGEAEENTYRFLWQGVMPKSYTVRARAIDSGELDAGAQIIINVFQKENSLLGYWNLDFGEGDIAPDSSPNGNQGKIVSALRVPAVSGGGLRFTGQSYVTVSQGLLNHLSAFTLAAWIKPAAGGDRRGLMGQHGVVELGFSSGNRLLFHTAGGGALEYDYPYPFNEWHHLAACGDGLGLRLYIDGKPVHSLEHPTSDYGDSTGYFNIGGNGIFQSYGNFFYGCLDEVTVYSNALSAEEIRLMLARINNMCPGIRITRPSPADTYYVSQEVLVAADVIDRGTELKGMEFYINGELEATINEEPYLFRWTPAETGNMTILAKAQNIMGNYGEDLMSIMVSGAEGNDKEPGLNSEQNKIAATEIHPLTADSLYAQEARAFASYPSVTVQRENTDLTAADPKSASTNEAAVPLMEAPNIEKLKYFIATPLALEYIPEKFVEQIVKMKKQNSGIPGTPTENKNKTISFTGLKTGEAINLVNQETSIDSRLFFVIIPILLYLLVVGLIFFNSRKKA
ncbi:MAG: hypothetical protein JW969_02190 [Spirochaetales bacterium]|nr:hypothetical protein [Spirochaetales bacterium]